MSSSLYRKAQYLSLDIVLGAVILLRFFSNTLVVDPPFVAYFLLGSSVWIVYTFDHIRDAKKAKICSRLRYQFHLRNEKNLRIIVLVFIVVCIGMTFYIRLSIFISGVFLAGFSVIYLLVQDLLARKGLKEFYVALVYTLGILIVPFVLKGLFELKIFISLFLLSYTNLIVFSWFEKEEDIYDGFTSLATYVSDSVLQKIILSMISLGISISISSDLTKTGIFFLAGFFVYATLFLQAKWSRKNCRFRTIGDGIFLMPILYEWV
ncbi:MAG: hypothetical protein AAF600_00305 [Bacteroidota bacterium]